MRWILLLLLLSQPVLAQPVLAQPVLAEILAPSGEDASGLPKSSVQLLQAMLPIEQKGLLPGGAAIRRLSVRHGDVTVVIARPQGADLAFRLLPRVGPAPDGEPVRIAVLAESTDEPDIEPIRLALVQLVRDKEGGFQWAGESSPPPVVVQAPSAPVQTPAPSLPAEVAQEPVPIAHVALAVFLFAFIGWAVLWHRRADARGEGS